VAAEETTVQIELLRRERTLSKLEISQVYKALKI
jgi:hypothetical protein